MVEKSRGDWLIMAAGGFAISPSQYLCASADANLEHGKALYERDAKPMSCNNCHGDAGDGTGKAGISVTPSPTNFTCKETMKDVSAGQMFYITKAGSAGTGMTPYKATMSDKDIWDVVKHIRSAFMK